MGKVFSVRDNSSRVEDSNRKSCFSTSIPSRVVRANDDSNILMIDFSPRLITFILLLLAAIFYSSQLITVIMFLFLGFVIMSSVKPVVNWFVKKGLSKGWSVALAYFILLILIQFVLVLVFVPFINQLAGLITILPQWINDALSYISNFSIGRFSLDVNTIGQYITDFIKTFPTANNIKNIAGFITNFFSTGAFIITSIVFSIYLVSEHDSFLDIFLIRIVSDEKRARVKKLVADVERKLGGWVLGQVFVSSLSAIFSGTVLTILGVPFALPLAIFTGLMGVIPNLGSTLSGIVMAIVALITVGPLAAIILLVAFMLYQALENTVIIPKVMGNAVGLKPIIVMLGVIIFLILFGLVGGFIAVPLMVVSKILYEFYIDLQKLKAKGIV